MSRRTSQQRPSRQRGVVLLFALIALLILMIGAVALVRSFNTSLFMAGNIGFKRDLQNRNDFVTTQVLASLAAGGALSDRTFRGASQPGLNYSAKLLSVDKQGIPDVLTRNDRVDQAPGNFTPTGADITPNNDNTVRIAYVIDRLCASAGDEKVLGPSQCATLKSVAQGAGLQQERNSDTSSALATNTISSAPIFVLYRVSARITGPRNTVSFFQSTIAVPS